MIGLGISCSLQNKRPVVVAVRGERKGNGVELKEVFRHVADAKDDFALQLVSIGNDLETHLPDLSPDAVVVRSMDHSVRRPRDDVHQKRYGVEGVLLSVCRRSVARVESLTGQAIGKALGVSKQVADDDAAAQVGTDFKEAGAAATVALRLAEEN